MHNFVTPSPLRGTSKMGEGAGGEVHLLPLLLFLGEGGWGDEGKD